MLSASTTVKTKPLWVVFGAGLVSLLLTASRASFIAYLIAISLVVFFISLRHSIQWGMTRWVGVITISILGMLLFGDLSQRFAHFFKTDQIKEYVLYEILKKERIPPGSEITGDLALVYTETDQPPVPLEPRELPPDVFENIPLAFPEATLSAGTDSAVASLAGKPRTYSAAAFTFGLSSAIRFDALWPRAIAGFLKNPLLGSGYSTLLKVQETEFTEAESQFSPDGRWVAYTSNESGRYEVYIQSFPKPSGKWQVSNGGGAHPRWRRDGKELFYVASDRKMMAAPIAISTGADSTVEAGAPVMLFEARTLIGTEIVLVFRQQYDVTADGQRFLMNVEAEGASAASPFTVVLNWQAGLKR